MFTDDLTIGDEDCGETRDRVSVLKGYGGKEIKKLARSLPDTAPVVGDDDYKKLKRRLDHHFLPQKNKQIHI